MVNKTICQCTIPDNATVGSKSFTVNVVKGGDDKPTSTLNIKIYDAASVKINKVLPAEFLTDKPEDIKFQGMCSAV